MRAPPFRYQSNSAAGGTSMRNTARPGAGREWARKQKKWPYLFVAPFVIGYLVFNLFPTLYSFYISLFDWNGIAQMKWVAFKNYATVFVKDALYWKSLWNTTVIMIISVPIQIGLGLLLAQYTFQVKRSFGQRLTQTALFLPYIISPIIIGALFSSIFDWQLGYLNDLLSRLGLIRTNVYWLEQSGSVRRV